MLFVILCQSCECIHTIDKFGRENICKNCYNICENKICRKKAVYNTEEFDYGIRCSKHKEKNMVNLMTKEQSKKRFIRNIKKLGGEVIGEYTGAYKTVKCKCKNGHICHPTPKHIQQGVGMCIICAKQCPITAAKNFKDTIKK